MKTISAYLAPRGLTHELVDELKDSTQIIETMDRLILTEGPPVVSHWAQNIWLDPIRIPFQSIRQAAQALKQIQRNWALYSYQLHRRAALIQDLLPKISSKPLPFPPSPSRPRPPMGSWTLLEPHLLLASPHCSSDYPHGEIQFQEDKNIPPSRAYLKLWEALTLIDQRPGPGDLCLDMGSSPGGWSWVLHELGAFVISVDKAPLIPQIAKLPRIRSFKQDAFTLTPEKLWALISTELRETQTLDWFCSDVICYPKRLLSLVLKWLDAKVCKNFICTIKFQGQTLSTEDQQAVRSLAAIPHSRIIHLFHNKHELTWIHLQK